VANTWRDPVASGPFRLEQVLDLGISAGAVVLLVLVLIRERRRGRVGASDGMPTEEDRVMTEPTAR
jgi:hypothetical protein